MMPSPGVGSGVEVRQTSKEVSLGAYDNERNGRTFDILEGENTQPVELSAV
jgi:hypothetical protein